MSRASPNSALALLHAAADDDAPASPPPPSLLEALLEDAIGIIDAPLAAMRRLPQHARQATSTAMHNLLLDVRSEHGLAVSAERAVQVHLASTPTEDTAWAPEGATTIAMRVEEEAQVTEQARAAQAELQRMNKLTQEIRAAHTKTIREHVAAFVPMEAAGERLKDASQTSWSLLLGPEEAAGASAMDVQAVEAAQAAEDAIFKRVEAEMQRYGIVEKVRAAADAEEAAAVSATAPAASTATEARIDAAAAAGEQEEELEPAAASAKPRSETDTEAGGPQQSEAEALSLSLARLSELEDPLEVARRHKAEEELARIQGLERRLLTLESEGKGQGGSSSSSSSSSRVGQSGQQLDLEGLFAREMAERRQQQRQEEVQQQRQQQLLQLQQQEQSQQAAAASKSDSDALLDTRI